jgi:hypothetical protein
MNAETVHLNTKLQFFRDPGTYFYVYVCACVCKLMNESEITVF